MTDRKAEFLTLLERYALTVARREGAVDYAELRATEALADELRTELLAFIGLEVWIAHIAELEAYVVELKRQLETCNSIIKGLAIERAVLLCKVKGIAPEDNADANNL